MLNMLAATLLFAAAAASAQDARRIKRVPACERPFQASLPVGPAKYQLPREPKRAVAP